MMLVHIEQPDVAQRVHNAWLATIEDGVHTYDIHKDGISKQKVGTKEFAEAVVARMGKLPQKLKAVGYGAARRPAVAVAPRPPAKRATQRTVGVDVYVGWANPDSDALAKKLQPLAAPGFELKMLTSRGIKVWPNGQPEISRTDECRCRFLGNGAGVGHKDIVALLSRIADAGLDFVKTETLSEFDGERGYSLGQGE
jgi:isocitrate dehydrogenase